jgi:hypothetical protein
VVGVRPDAGASNLPVGPTTCYHGIMKKQTVIPRKKRGPRPTGKGEPVVVRMHPPQIKALDAWIAQQPQPFPTRPEAVRQLLEIVLASNGKRPRRSSDKGATMARDLASKTIDSLIDPSAPAEQKAIRKRRLLKGPSDFRDVRVDREK